MGSIDGNRGGLSRGVAVQGLDELPQGGDGLEIERLRDVDELDRAQAPSPAFVFGDEGLRLAEVRGNIRLRQPSLLAKVTQQLAELDLARRAQRVAHRLKPGSKMTASSHNPDFGLSHFGIYLKRPMAERRSKAS